MKSAISKARLGCTLARWLAFVLLLASFGGTAQAKLPPGKTQLDLDRLASILDQRIRADDPTQATPSTEPDLWSLGKPKVKGETISWPVASKENPKRVVGRLFWRRHSAKPSPQTVAGGTVDLMIYKNKMEVTNLLIRSAQRVVESSESLPDEFRALQPQKNIPFNTIHIQRFGIGLLILVVWMLASLWRRKQKPTVEWQLKANHLLPAILQSTIFVYWGIYDKQVLWYAPNLIAQLLLAYVIDAILAWMIEGKWRIGAGPLPIVLSANLFAWYLEPWKVGLVITIALASKYWVRHKDGSVVFNPSGVALATMAIAFILAPKAWSFNGTFQGLRLCPNLSEVILLLALIPQRRFPIVLVSVGSALGLMAAKFWFPDPPGIFLPGTVLAFTLLVTEPRTMAKTGLGRLLQGVAFGILIAVSSEMYDKLHLADDFAKVLPLPLVNLLGRPLDALVNKLPKRLTEILSPTHNSKHMVMFLILMGITSQHKEGSFAPHNHWKNQTPILVQPSDRTARCEENPAFCVPFGFGYEVAAWARTLNAP